MGRTVGPGRGVEFGGDSLRGRINSYIETDVRNRPEGIRVTFPISKALPIRGEKRQGMARAAFATNAILEQSSYKCTVGVAPLSYP
jgi:hypothetical protein